MRRRRKSYRQSALWRWTSFLVLLGVVLLALIAYTLLFIAQQLGLEPEAFVVAGLAGLGTLVLYGGILAVIYFFYQRAQQAKRVRALQIADVDRMTGTRFEEYVAQLLQDQGYQVKHTGASGDLGVDLVARNGQFKYAVQIKRQADAVSRRAVSDAVAGMAQYGCNAAMVVTNNYFSPGAQELARANHCVLIDRERLARWIIEFQRGGGAPSLS